MKEKKTIVVLANKYPNEFEPNINVFTQQITWSFVDQGYQCIVICPVALNYKRYNKNFSYRRIETTESGKSIEIYHPKYYGFGQSGKVYLKSRVYFTTKAYIAAVDKVLKDLHRNNIVLFAEFLCPSGVAASILGGKYSIPSFVQCGESTYQGDKKYGNRKLATKWLKNITGIIALSGHVKNHLIDANIISDDKIIILPSGYRKDRISQKNKMESRKKFGLPEGKFIVGFCGSFDERKGVQRLARAIEEIDDNEIVLAACGKGNAEPFGDKIVFKGPINHSELSWFYSAIDVFAFPTYNEGCCTSIVEAIACGCAIISSNRAFNYEICDQTNSILIEPDDIEEMKASIIKIKKNDKLRYNMQLGSINKAKELSLDNKARKLLNFMGL